jgi:replicative DNA helicase
MVALQILNRVIQTHDFSIIENNQLTEEYFVEYSDEYRFIATHMKQYGNVPDKATFLQAFPDFEFIEVTESERYLVETIREEYLYYKSVPVVQTIAKLLKTDANAAAEYMIQSMRELQPNYNLGGTDIIANAEDRYNEFLNRRDNQDNWFFTSGFPELDDVIHGIQRGEELFVIFARTNQGKSWILEKICTHVWEIGFNVGYISPEMGELSIGYRFDTLYKNFSNKDLMWGNKDFDADTYHEYIEQLKSHKNKFMVATPNDFDRKITVTKLKKWIQQYKLELIAIDGITYLSDERYKRGDNKTTSLTNISEDLMALSMELGVPVIVVVQANRNGVVDKENEDTPELESIRDSDGISHNASKVLSIKQSNDGILTMQVKKQRNGRVGDKIQYQWNPNIGEFIPLSGGNIESHREKKKIVEKEDVF